MARVFLVKSVNFLGDISFLSSDDKQIALHNHDLLQSQHSDTDRAEKIGVN